MSRKKRYMTIDEIERKLLQQSYKTGKSASFRERCHAILLSAEGKSISELCSIFHVLPNAITNWFNRWEKGKIEGLKTVPGRPLSV